MTNKAGGRLLFYILAGLCCVVIFSLWSEKGLATKDHEDISPKEWYRVETYSPFSLSKLVLEKALGVSVPRECFYPFALLVHITSSMEIPCFVKVYDHRTNRLLHTSKVFDCMCNGEIFWPDKDDPRLGIGMDENMSFRLPPEPE